MTVILLYGSGRFTFTWVNYDLLMWFEQLYGFMSDEQKEDYKESVPKGTWTKYFSPTSTSIAYAFFCILLLMFILGGLVAYLHWTQ